MKLILALAACLIATCGVADAQTYRSGVLQFSMLPTSRSVGVGETATVFGTVISSASLNDCELVLGEGAPGATLSWRLLDSNNQLTDDPENAHFSTTGVSTVNPNGVPQNLLVAISSPTPVSNANVEIFTRCANTGLGATFDYYRNPTYPGVNTLLLNANTSPTPDILAIGQSLTSDGYVRLPTAGARRPAAIAAVNIGAAGAVTVAANTGDYPLPVEVTLCETDSNGVCLAPRAASLSVNFATNQVRTFNVYVQSDGAHGVANLPAIARVYFEFGVAAAAGDVAEGADVQVPSANLGTRYGATSFAVVASPPSDVSESIVGVYRGLIFGGNGGPSGSFPATVVVYGPNSMFISERSQAGWAATTQGRGPATGFPDRRAALSQSAIAFSGGTSATRTASNAVNRQGGNVFPASGINAQITNLFASPYTFTYQAVYDPVAEQTLSGHLTAESSAIIGQAFDIFYNGTDIGDLDTGSEANGGGVGTATVTWPGQAVQCTVTVSNLRLNQDRTTWHFVAGKDDTCGVPSFDLIGFVDDTQGPRRIELFAYARTENNGAFDTFPIVLVAK